MSVLLTARNLRKEYGSFVALADFSLDVRSGAVHGLLGPNGSGKTTCLYLLTGLVPPTGGTVAVAGIPITDKASRTKYGFAPDDLPMPSGLTGGEYLAWLDRLRRRQDQARALQLVEAFGLQDSLWRPIGEYSHGMRRKLQVIGAIMHSPEVLFLDEPFRGLDPAAAVGLSTCIDVFKENGGAVVVATHDLLRAERDCDTVTILDKGQVIGTGEPTGLRVSATGAATLEAVFLARTGVTDTGLAQMSNSISRALRG